MPTFGSRRKSAPETISPKSTPEPASLSALERLQALLAEQSEINATLDQHREKRAALLRGDGSLDAIRELETEDGSLRLRLEQITLRVPDIEQELARERREEFECAWETHRPGLVVAQAELAETIRAFYATLDRATAAYNAASGFGRRLTDEFVRPPPPIIFNDYALREFVKAIERRQHSTAAPAPVEVAIEAPLHLPPEQRFAPRRVPYQLVEQVSPIAPMRRVRMLHTIRASNLAIGHARLREGQEMMFPARAAFVLTFSGVGVYTDMETAETTAAA